MLPFTSYRYWRRSLDPLRQHTCRMGPIFSVTAKCQELSLVQISNDITKRSVGRLPRLMVSVTILVERKVDQQSLAQRGLWHVGEYKVKLT